MARHEPRLDESELIVDLQLNQGSASWSVLRDGALAAEEAGFSTLWNLDHFSGDIFGVDSMLECFTCLGAWGAITSRIGLGTMVANVNNRTPGLLANAATTVQEVSEGRLILGVGSGASPSGPFGGEHRALDIQLLPTMAERHERLIQVVDTVREIWSPARAEKYRGFPRPLRAPRVIAGINSEGLARVAGRHLDGVNIRFNHPERARLIATSLEASGGSATFEASVWAWFEPELADPDHPFHAELAAEGVGRLVLLVRGAPDPDVIASTARYMR